MKTIENEVKAMNNTDLYNGFCSSLEYPAPGMTSGTIRDSLIRREFEKRLKESGFLSKNSETKRVDDETPTEKIKR